jgi:hypothetical protein
MPQIAGLRGVLADPQSAGTPARDGSRALYRYHQVFAGPGRSFVRKSLICAVRLSPWTEGSIRPHEATSPAARDLVLATIKRDNAYAIPVLCGFRDPATEVDRLMRKAEGGKPTLELTTPDGTVHRVWRVQDAEVLGKLRHYFAPKKLHVLEGHDRYEAMLAYQEELAGKHALAMYSSANYGLAALTSLDDPALATAPRHKIVRGTGAKSDVVLATAKTHFIIDKLAGKELATVIGALRDTVAHQPAFVAVFAGDPDAYKLTLSPDVSPVAEGVAIDRSLQKLDPVVVQHMFVDRALPGAQVTSESDAAAALAAKDCDAVLITRPLSVEQIAHVDEVGGLLPAGSTAFHPAMAPNLVRMVIDPDEDLV